MRFFKNFAKRLNLVDTKIIKFCKIFGVKVQEHPSAKSERNFAFQMENSSFLAYFVETWQIRQFFMTTVNCCLRQHFPVSF